MISPNWFKPYADDEYWRREVLSLVLMIAGMIWFAVLQWTSWHVGIITAFVSIFAGAAFGCYMERKTERGVWMLAFMIGGLTVIFYLFVIVTEILDHINRRVSPHWWLPLDVTTAGMIVRVVIRASWTVFRQNRKLS